MHDKPFMVFCYPSIVNPLSFISIIRLAFYITLKRLQYRNYLKYRGLIEFRAIKCRGSSQIEK